MPCSVECVATVQIGVRSVEILRAGRQNSPLHQPSRKNLMRSAEVVAEMRAGSDRIHRCCLRVVHQLVNPTLRLTEMAADRDRARDVGRVKRNILNAGVGLLRNPFVREG